MIAHAGQRQVGIKEGSGWTCCRGGRASASDVKRCMLGCSMEIRALGLKTGVNLGAKTAWQLSRELVGQTRCLAIWPMFGGRESASIWHEFDHRMQLTRPLWAQLTIDAGMRCVDAD